MSDTTSYLTRIQPNGPVNPFQGFTQGLSLGNALQERRTLAEQQKLANEQAIETQRIANEAAQAKIIQQEQMMEAMRKLSSPDRTIEDYDQFDLLVSATMPPEQAKGLREATANMRAEEAQAMLSGNMRVFSALLNGAPDIAVKDLRTQAEALRNSGEPDPAIILDEWANNIEKSPAGAKTIENLLAYTIMETPGGREAMENAIKYNQERRDAAAEPTVQLKRLADIGFTEAQTNKLLAETKKLGVETNAMLDEAERVKNALPAGKELSASAEKNVNDAVLAAAKANSLATQYTTLATDFDKAITTAGVGARLSEQINKIFGTEKEPTALRQEFLRLRNTAVLEMLPPGVASDKDVELALAAFPSETSAPANIAGFLRGMSKLQAYEGAVSNAQAEWIQQNGTLGTAMTKMTVGNREVKPGERFTDFIKTYVPNTSVITPGGAGAVYGTGTTSTTATTATETTEVDF